ncbi:MAG: hypothetical protein Q4B17_09645 [Lautropia sp.]|nr:hypothetical protein [Lautropia sp.]
MLPIASFRRPLAALATTLCLLLPHAGQATPALSVEELPNDLKGWVPWAMQGHENLACPVAHDDHQHRSCVWPSRLEISIEGRVGRFSSTVEVIGERSAVMLPGESGAWPTGVQTQDGRAWPVTSQGERPVVWLPPGRHVLSGQIRWQQTPRTVRVPAHTGLLSVRSHGTELNPVTDRADRLWLQQTDAPTPSAPELGNRLELRIHRRIDDAIPRRITTHYELNVAGQPREIELPAALLADTQAEALRSALPARLYPDGRLQVQLRAGAWQIEVDARQMKPVEALSLPPGAGPEIWSYEGHNDLHVSEIEGVESIDPDQAGVPKPWRRLPAYQMQADSQMLIVPKTRGDAAPAGNSLQLTRELWLDFDGQGMTQLDHLNGTLSRGWRLELSPPARLGYANANGTALPINRLPAGTADTTANPGIELRHQELSLEALSRIEGRPAELPVNGWNTVLSSVDTVLHLPPGWMLLSTTGVQEISPATWTSRWRLFDLFFVLLGGIAAFRLLGAARGALMSVAIVLSWCELAFVGSSWLMLLLCVALLRALTGASRLRPMILVAANSLLALILLVMLPFSVQQIRSIIYPGLEHSHAYNPSREHLYSATKAAETARPSSMRTKAQQALEQAADDSGVRSAPYLSPPQPPRSQQAIQIQTGPGLPAWEWNRYELRNSGDVQPEESMRLYLLPPLGSALHHTVLLFVLYAALWQMFRAVHALRHPPAGDDKVPPASATPRAPTAGTTPMDDAAPESGQTASSPATAQDDSTASGKGSSPGGGTASPAIQLALVLGLALWALPPAMASEPQPGPRVVKVMTQNARPTLGTEKAALLEELRNRLHPPADCQPSCAAVAQLRVTADRERLTLALSVHAQIPTQLPLPGRDTTGNWHPTQVLLDDRAAMVRRDERGQLWVQVPEGIHALTLNGPLGAGNSIRIPLPMPPHTLTVQAGPWQASGLSPDGQPREGLLNLDLPAQPKTDSPQKQLSHVPDALPGFALVERTLSVGDRWQTRTRITRQGPSRAPVRVRFALLPGESINDERVRMHDGAAEILLSGQNSLELKGTLPATETLTWQALPSLFQIERWQLQVSSRWHPSWEGLTPIHYAQGSDGVLAPRWQPWPGESLKLHISAPEVIPGPTLTLERQRMKLEPGQHSTTVETTLSLRASLAGTHGVTLPADAGFLGMTLDGAHVPVQAQQGRVDIPIVPGEHEVVLRWREARGVAGIGQRFHTSQLETRLDGTNAITTLNLPHDRVVLAAGGPPIGPAVLFWGFVPLILIASMLLARSRRTPLGPVSWFLLLLGLAQASMLGAAIVATGLLALGIKPSIDEMHKKGWDRGWISGVQIAMAIWTLAMLLILYQTVHTALLGYPNMLITGNESGAHHLAWYQDRFASVAESSWVFSISLTTYRVAMLAWALWLASSLLGWIRWGWQRFSAGGYWPDDDDTPKGSTPAARPAPNRADIPAAGTATEALSKANASAAAAALPSQLLPDPGLHPDAPASTPSVGSPATSASLAGLAPPDDTTAGKASPKAPRRSFASSLLRWVLSIFIAIIVLLFVAGLVAYNFML